MAIRGVPVIPIKRSDLGGLDLWGCDASRLQRHGSACPRRAIADAQAVLLASGYERKDCSSAPGGTEQEDGPYGCVYQEADALSCRSSVGNNREVFHVSVALPWFWKHRVPLVVANKTVQGLAPENLLLSMMSMVRSMCGKNSNGCAMSPSCFAHTSNSTGSGSTRMHRAWRCRRLVSMGLSLAHRLLDAPLPEAVRAALRWFGCAALIPPYAAHSATDCHAGAHQSGGWILSLIKRFMVEALKFGLMLCRDQNPLVMIPPARFRWRTSLPRPAFIILSSPDHEDLLPLRFEELLIVGSSTVGKYL